MEKARGMTLTELLVALAIAALLTTLAVPSFKRLVQSNTISSGVNAFLADVRYARSEAIRLGGRVVICRSNDPEGAPACDSGATNWAAGWIVFQDREGTTAGTDPNEAYDAAGDRLLRVQGPLSGVGTITSVKGSPTVSVTKLGFSATGRLYFTDGSSTAGTTKLTFGDDAYAAEIKRVICLGVGGRARMAGDGTATCE